MRRWSRIGRALVAAAGLALAACVGPEGPGTVTGRVTGSATLGAAVLDVTWPGIQGFEGQGSTQAYSARVGGFPDRHRLVLVDGAGGELRFSIDVDDVYLEGPVVVVVDAAGTDNRPMPVTDLRVVLER